MLTGQPKIVAGDPVSPANPASQHPAYPQWRAAATRAWPILLTAYLLQGLAALFIVIGPARECCA